MNTLHKDLKKLVATAESQPVKRKWRPQFHLAPPVGWLNDPNGLCRLGDEYHVFYQYAPFDPEGGLKLWGHYKSTDMLHWEQLSPALFPDQPWDCHGVYSGSALVEEDGLYLYYTGNVKLLGEYDYISQGREHNTCLAISRDGGKTFLEKHLLMVNQDYPQGLTCHVRDPKVWREGNTYFMLQGARTLEDQGVILLFQSSDRFHWHYKNTLSTHTPLGYMWECPDFFCLEGQTYLSISPQGLSREERRFQNVYQSGYTLLSGSIEGEHTLGDFLEYDYGFDFYAPQTFDDQGRRILIGWMGMPDAEEEYTNPTKELGWQHCLTVPRELYLKNKKLCQRPVRELKELRGQEVSCVIKGTGNLPKGRVFDLELTMAGGSEVEATPLELDIRNCALLRWEAKTLTLSFKKAGYGRGVRRVTVERLENLRILADESSLEIFANYGEFVMTSRYFPEERDQGIQVCCGEVAITMWGLL